MFTSSARIYTTLLVCWLVQVTSSASTPRKPKGDLTSGQNCTNHLQIIDRCSSLATYSYTTEFNQYPVNGNEFRASCERISDGLKCLKTHTKCLANLARRSLTTFSGSRSRHSKRLCTNPDDLKSQDFWKSAECIVSKKTKRDSMITNERELISTIQLLATIPQMKWEERFHQGCCAASSYKVKVLRDIEPDCTKYKQTIEDMMNSMIGDLLESACPDQNRLNDLCPKLPKLTLPKEGEWKAASLTGAALDLIVKLADGESKN